VRLPARLRTFLAWVALPIVAGALVATSIDLTAPPFSGRERLAAVFLLDGQAYFGHLDDNALSGTMVLRDVYYFADASKTTADLQIALTQRGNEVHQPVSEMRIRRDKVLVVEHVTLDSPVARAIAAQRAIGRIEASH
jgi:hypothetical protein